MDTIKSCGNAEMWRWKPTDAQRIKSSAKQACGGLHVDKHASTECGSITEDNGEMFPLWRVTISNSISLIFGAVVLFALALLPLLLLVEQVLVDVRDDTTSGNRRLDQ